MVLETQSVHSINENISCSFPSGRPNRLRDIVIDHIRECVRPTDVTRKSRFTAFPVSYFVFFCRR